MPPEQGCQYADLIAVGGNTEPECPNEADVDLDLTAGAYKRTYALCEDHALYVMQTVTPAAHEVVLEGKTKEGDDLMITLDREASQ